MKQNILLGLLFTLAGERAYTQSNTLPMDSTTANEIKHSREFFESLGRIYPVAEHVSVSPETIAGRACYWFTPETKTSSKIIVYLHGGAFGMGSLQSHKAMVSHLADSLKATILFIDYGLAPEHPYPAGLNDVLAVYKQLLKKHPAQSLVMMGDSAGGGLVLSALGSMQDSGLGFPAGIVMISPWLDIECNNHSYAENKHSDPILTQAELQKFAKWYAPAGTAKANPEQVKLKSLPPLLLVVGSGEILLDDSRHFYEKTRQLQKNVTFHIYPNQPHVWPLTDINSESSKQLMSETHRFISALK